MPAKYIMRAWREGQLVGELQSPVPGPLLDSYRRFVQGIVEEWPAVHWFVSIIRDPGTWSVRCDVIASYQHARGVPKP